MEEQYILQEQPQLCRVFINNLKVDPGLYFGLWEYQGPHYQRRVETVMERLLTPGKWEWDYPVVFEDRKGLYLAFGFDVYDAAVQLRLMEIEVLRYDGSKSSALLFAAQYDPPNLRRYRDRGKALKRLLLDEECQTWSGARLGEWLGLTSQHVNLVRRKMTMRGDLEPGATKAINGRYYMPRRQNIRETPEQKTEGIIEVTLNKEGEGSTEVQGRKFSFVAKGANRILVTVKDDNAGNEALAPEQTIKEGFHPIIGGLSSGTHANVTGARIPGPTASGAAQYSQPDAASQLAVQALYPQSPAPTPAWMGSLSQHGQAQSPVPVQQAITAQPTFPRYPLPPTPGQECLYELDESRRVHLDVDGVLYGLRVDRDNHISVSRWNPQGGWSPEERYALDAENKIDLIDLGKNTYQIRLAGESCLGLIDLGCFEE